MKVTDFALFLLLGVSVPAIAQDTQDSPPISDVGPITQDTQTTQPAQSVQGDKPENPAEPEAHGTRLRWKDLPKNLWKDQKAIASSPLHINRDNAKWWILFGAGTAALLATDRTVSDHLPQSNTQLRVSKWASRAGADYTIYPLTASTVSIARVAGRRHSPSDAFVGSAMGFFIGDYVYRHHHAPSAKANTALWLANHVNIGFQVSH